MRGSVFFVSPINSVFHLTKFMAEGERVKKSKDLADVISKPSLFVPSKWFKSTLTQTSKVEF